LNRIKRFPQLVWNRLSEQGLRATSLWLTEHAVRVTTGAPRLRTSQITPRIAVGGQYRRRGWPRLEKAGITGVLNLREEFCDAEAGIAPASYLRLSTADDDAPTMEQLGEGVAFIEQEVGRGGGVYIHCGAGVGRAATMAAAYLVAQGDGPEEAWARIRKVRPFIRPTVRQQKALEAWAAYLGDGTKGSL
jgi:hypothetical protein